MKGHSGVRPAAQLRQQAVSVVRDVYAEHDGGLGQSSAKVLSLSHRARAKEVECVSKDQEVSLTYGEVTAVEFIKLLDTYERLSGTFGSAQGEGRVFVDLGSGRGLPSMCAATSTAQFSLIWGIEIIPELVEISLQLRDKVLRAWREGHRKSVPESKKPMKDSRPLIDHVVTLIHENCGVGSYLSLEAIADLLCKRLGHKRYRELMKGHKTLRRYLGAFADRVAMNAAEDAALISSFEEPTAGQLVEPVAAHAVAEATATGVCDLWEGGPLPDIRFDCADGFVLDWWSTADLVYAASLLFSEEMMLCLAEKVARMRPRTWFVSLKPLPLTIDQQRTVVLRHDAFFRMSWKMANVYFYQVVATH